MLERLYFPALAIVAAALIALALVWPQGLGARSPAPFGREPVQSSAEYQDAMRRQNEATQRRLNRTHSTIVDLQTKGIAPAQ